MAVKPIISIDVDDSAFQRFLDLYQSYKDSLHELPKHWQRVGEEIEKAAGSTGDMTAETRSAVASLAALSGAARSMAGSFDGAREAQGKFAEGMGRVIGGLGKITELANAATGGMGRLGTAMHIAGKQGLMSGANMISSGNTGMGLFGGLAMTAGVIMLASGAVLAGMAKFASFLGDTGYSAVGRWREAKGVGMSPGQAEAFRTYLNPYVEADQIAASVANARNDVTQRWRFAAAGISQNDLANKTNFDLSEEVVKNIQSRLKAMPEATWLNQAKAMGFDAFMSEESMRRLRSAPVGDVSEALRKAAESRKDLDFTDKTAKAWIDLTTTLHKARMEIETGFIIGLQHAAPVLEDMAKNLGEWIKDFLVSGRFEADVRGLLEVIENIVKFGRRMGIFPDSVPPPPGTKASEMTPPVDEARKQTEAKLEHSAWYYLLHPEEKGTYPWDFSKPEEMYNLPSGILSGVAKVESDFNADAVSKSGAQGMFQIMPKTQDFIRNNLDKTHRSIDPFDAAEESYAAGLYLSHLMKKYQGDEEKSLAAYNWGDANVDAASKQWGKDWKAHIPSQVQDYVDKVEAAKKRFAKPPAEPSSEKKKQEEPPQEKPHQESMLHPSVFRALDGIRKAQTRKQQIMISVNNSTGSNVAVQANAASYG